jgi:hypothetical protein
LEKSIKLLKMLRKGMRWASQLNVLRSLEDFGVTAQGGHDWAEED